MYRVRDTKLERDVALKLPTFLQTTPNAWLVLLGHACYHYGSLH